LVAEINAFCSDIFVAMILKATKDSYSTGWLALVVPESGVFYDELPSSQAIRTYLLSLEVDRELCKALQQISGRILHIEKIFTFVSG
jgi:hypothetical protein